MNINIRDCVGKHITFRAKSGGAMLSSGVVEQILNENVVKIGSEHYLINLIEVTSVDGCNVSESSNGSDQLIKG